MSGKMGWQMQKKRIHLRSIKASGCANGPARWLLRHYDPYARARMAIHRIPNHVRAKHLKDHMILNSSSHAVNDIWDCSIAVWNRATDDHERRCSKWRDPGRATYPDQWTDC